MPQRAWRRFLMKVWMVPWLLLLAAVIFMQLTGEFCILSYACHSQIQQASTDVPRLCRSRSEPQQPAVQLPGQVWHMTGSVQAAQAMQSL